METILKLLLSIMLVRGCSSQPNHLSGTQETITVTHINWACDCADFIETRLLPASPDEEIKEEECIFIEPAESGKAIPDSFYSKAHFNYHLQLTGEFYTDKGIPDSYDRKTPEKPKVAKVFRYKSFE